MTRTHTLADGQLAAATASILAGSSIGDVPIKVSAIFYNSSASTTETVIVTLLRSGGTARVIARAVLSPNETLVVSGLPIQTDDTLKGVTTNAVTVDYVVTLGEGPLTIQRLDANGALSTGSAVTGGAQTLTGAKTFATMPIIPSATVAATGTNQSTAAAITTGFTLVTAADDAVGVKLPTAVAGLVCIVKSSVSNKILKVYPNTSDAINAIAADSAMSLASGPTAAIFVAYDATTWYTIPLLPS